MVGRRTATAALGALVGALVLALAPPASAGGVFLAPVQDTYQPAEVATLVGYATAAQPGWVQEAPFYAYLFAGLPDFDYPSGPPSQGLPLGPVTLEPSTGGYGLRVSISFVVPAALTPGPYQVLLCNEPCRSGLGDIVAGRLYVGVEPAWPVMREWPQDEPEIANLAADALLAGFGYTATAAQVRAGEVVEPQGPGGTGYGPPTDRVAPGTMVTVGEPAPVTPPATTPEVMPAASEPAEEGTASAIAVGLLAGTLALVLAFAYGSARRRRKSAAPVTPSDVREAAAEQREPLEVG